MVSASEDARVPPGSGWISWEATTPTGEVLAHGERVVRPTEFEVMITQARPVPRLSRLRLGPKEVAGDLLSWVVWRGRARSTRRLRLDDGFWLVLQQHPGPTLPLGMALQATRDGEDTFCWEWFDTDGTPTTATKLKEAGALTLELEPDAHGNHEVVSTTFATDVSLRLRADGGRDRSGPRYRVRVLAGSVVRWPRADDGVRLVPRLRPTPG
ncbi:hypothetical protein [Microlunatus flavus]|uniref:Uncharacterized protein n=1 Tax=Microlunatus flavus TaxID=1036181 RepID=A0A1H9ER87_9ACTN|nr:hypothetical protein [Microlunatus flavus]SEQ28214.1 hypothetical protein SAMN05421756_10326 [Microlunatus flavus]